MSREYWALAGLGLGTTENLRLAYGLLPESELGFELQSFGVSQVVTVDHEALEADD